MSEIDSNLRRPRPLTAVVLGIAGLLYAYGVWNAIAYAATMVGQEIGGGEWAILVFGAVFPVLVFAVAYAIGRRRGTWALAASLLAGLGLVAVFWLNIVAYSIRW